MEKEISSVHFCFYSDFLLAFQAVHSTYAWLLESMNTRFCDTWHNSMPTHTHTHKYVHTVWDLVLWLWLSFIYDKKTPFTLSVKKEKKKKDHRVTVMMRGKIIWKFLSLCPCSTSYKMNGLGQSPFLWRENNVYPLRLLGVSSVIM